MTSSGENSESRKGSAEPMRMSNSPNLGPLSAAKAVARKIRGDNEK